MWKTSLEAWQMNNLLSSSSSSSNRAIAIGRIAYGCLYTPNHLLTFTPSRSFSHLLHHRHRRRRRRRRTVSLLRPPTLSSSSCHNFLTGNSHFCGMAWMLSGRGIHDSKGMVEGLKSYGVISSSKVAEVMCTVDRALFVPEGSSAYEDSPMSIGYNATISAPHMHATCLQLLEKNLQPDMHALDVGSGTGYLTACFALMVGPKGRAVGVEHIPELVSSSIENIQKSAVASLLKEGSLSVHVGDGRQGWPEFAPYDAIHVGAAAPEIPQPLIDQLKPGGRMVIPVGNVFQDLKVVDKNMDGSVSIRTETAVRYVPLTSRDAQLRGH